jgi:soluble lytic murein transglycosylase-like protein
MEVNLLLVGFEMAITIVNYLNQDLVDKVNEQALARQLAAEEAAKAASAESFSDALSSATVSYTAESTPTTCSAYLDSIFNTAAETYGVSSNLLKSIARAESNFNATATSSAGACGIMQLMPETAASLGVSNIYDVTENIMGGAKYIAQLLEKYSGNTSLALAAYNAGSAAVETYGGIPPYTETQNYVSKVLSYLNGTFEVDYTAADTAASSTLTREEATAIINKLIEAQDSNPDALDLLTTLLGNINI